VARKPRRGSSELEALLRLGSTPGSQRPRQASCFKARLAKLIAGASADVRLRLNDIGVVPTSVGVGTDTWNAPDWLGVQCFARGSDVMDATQSDSFETAISPGSYSSVRFHLWLDRPAASGETFRGPVRVFSTWGQQVDTVVLRVIVR